MLYLKIRIYLGRNTREMIKKDNEKHQDENEKKNSKSRQILR